MRVLLLAVAAVACAQPHAEMLASSTDSTTADGSSSTMSSTSDDTTSTSSSGTSSTTAVDTSDDGGSVFIIDDDGGVHSECDLWAQDCRQDEKCMPWASDGEGSWNATRCTPLARMPRELGESCTVEEYPTSGIDDCKLGAMCFFVDPKTNIGECVGFCTGSEANPTCEDPNAFCNIMAESVLLLCLDPCDPLVQGCGAGESCVPMSGHFSCFPDDGGDTGAYGDPCEFVNVCDPGLFCANPESVPDCEGSNGCCSPFCDISDPNATANCPGVLGGQECVAWYEEGQAPRGYENLGACMIPQ